MMGVRRALTTTTSSSEGSFRSYAAESPADVFLTCKGRHPGKSGVCTGEAGGSRAYGRRNHLQALHVRVHVLNLHANLTLKIQESRVPYAYSVIEALPYIVDSI